MASLPDPETAPATAAAIATETTNEATTITTKASRAPFPTDPDEFDADTRISYSKTSQTHVLEDEHGEEWEWLARVNKWVPVVRNIQNPPVLPGRLWPAYITRPVTLFP